MGRPKPRQTRREPQGHPLFHMYIFAGCLTHLKRLRLTGEAGLSKSRTAASFIRPTRPADEPRSFASAIRYKYASETAGNGPASTGQIVISGKVAEEVGFDHVRRKLAQLQELKIVILDGMRIDCAAREGEDSVADTCPRVVQLDLSRNLFESLIPIMCICRDLSALRKLSLKYGVPPMKVIG